MVSFKAEFTIMELRHNKVNDSTGGKDTDYLKIKSTLYICVYKIYICLYIIVK